MRIPVAKPYLTEEDAKNAYETILSGWVTQGPKVQEFEEKFAEYVGAEYAVAVSNGTAALHLSLEAAGIKAGDEVICPSLSFIATANAISYTGAKPVFAEIDPETYNLDAAHTEALIGEKTRAILIVHQMGFPADIDAFQQLCRRHGLTLIEDAACAAGSSYKGKKIGSHSDLVCFSFHPRKVITTGDGGMITTSDESYYKRLRLLRQHGMSVNDRERHSASKVILEEYLELGYNYRLTDIQAAIGIRQLEKLEWLVSERRKIAEKYDQKLREIEGIRIPAEREGYSSNYQSYSICLEGGLQPYRNTIMQKLLDSGIATRRGIMTIHREGIYRDDTGATRLPVSESISDSSILLPLFVPMEDSEIEYVAEQLKGILTMMDGR